MTGPPQIPYRGRLAPSPTGFLHLGHARTFWIAWSRARAAQGTLVLRNEDLDFQRCKPEFVSAMFEDLRWLGLDWDEGPDIPPQPGKSNQPGSAALGGPFAPYSQSQRRSFYLDAWRKLRDSGLIYPCTCSRKDLERALSAPHEEPLHGAPLHGAIDKTINTRGAQAWDPQHARFSHNEVEAPSSANSSKNQDNRGAQARGPQHARFSRDGVEVPSPAHVAAVVPDDELPYPGTCRDKISTAANYDSPAGVSWRFKVPGGETISFLDGHFGPQQFIAGKDFSDFLLWRRDDIPAYQLAVVADDAAMQITEVVRGEDLLKSTARQLLLIRALGYRVPQYFHCPLLRDANNLRLAKRHDALSLRTMRAQGTSAETLRQQFAAETKM